MELGLYSTHSMPLYHKQFDYDTGAFFRVKATEIILVPGGTKNLRAHIQNWARSPIHLTAFFEP